MMAVERSEVFVSKYLCASSNTTSFGPTEFRNMAKSTWKIPLASVPDIIGSVKSTTTKDGSLNISLRLIAGKC
jgi:hypothetical protein